jgi:hypothetical protein
MSISLSGSLVITGSILSTQGIVGYATTGSNSFVGSQQITGSLTVSCAIIAQTINVQQVTSSIVYSCGSNQFGCALSDKQQFTGSVSITGSLSVNGTSAVTGTGTTNYLPKFTGASTIGDSIIEESASGLNVSKSNSGGSNVFEFQNTSNTASSNSRLKIATGGTSAGNAILQFTDNTNNWYINPDSSASYSLKIGTSISDNKIVLTTSGNLGLGVTPSAWQSFRGLQVGQVGAFASNDFGSGNIQTYVGNNVYYDNTGFKYIQAGVASMMRMTSVSAAQWEVAPSGTAGNAITFTQAMTLDASGNLALGTTSPSSTTWNRYAQIEGVYPGLILNSTASGGVKYSIGSDASTFILRDETSAATRMAVNSSGNVGIGTTSPANLLHLAGASATPSLRLGSVSAGFHWDIGRENLTTGDFVFNNANGGSTSEKMRITVGGNVGIGTASPNAKLEIAQNADNTDGPTLRIANNGNTLSNGQLIGAIDFYNGDDSGTGDAVGAYIRSYTADATLPVSSQYLSFASGGVTERMRITSAGNVLINGTTVQNNATGRGNLTINGTTSILNLSTSDTNAGYLFHGGTDMLLVNAKNGAQLFYTNDTERMRITSGGITCFSNAICAPCIVLTSNSNTIFTYSTGAAYCRFLYAGACSHLLYPGGPTAQGGVVGVNNFEDNSRLFNMWNTGVSCFSNTVCAPCFATISDYRMKSNLQPIDGLSIIMNTKPYKFNYNYDCSTSFGMIAHELQDILPEAVFGHKDGEVMQGVDYMKLLPIAIKAIQELKSQNDIFKTCLGII